MEQHPLPLPQDSADVTAAWLSRSLQAAFEHCEIHSLRLERIAQEFGFRSRIYRCSLTGTDVPSEVIVKLWRADEAGSLREANFYRSLAAGCGLRLPRCYFSAVDEQAGTGALVLEYLSNIRQGDCLQQLDASSVALLATRMGVFHATYWGAVDYLADWLPSTVQRERDLVWHTSKRERFFERYGEVVDPLLASVALSSDSCLSLANKLLESTVPTLIHGDLHLDNVLFVSGTDEAIVLDWANCSAGPAVVDLAELMFAVGRAVDCEKTYDAYLASLMSKRRLSDADVEQLRRELTGAVLRRAVAATLGIAMWDPPGQRAEQIIRVDFARQAEALRWLTEQNPALIPG